MARAARALVLALVLAAVRAEPGNDTETANPTLMVHHLTTAEPLILTTMAPSTALQTATPDSTAGPPETSTKPTAALLGDTEPPSSPTSTGATTAPSTALTSWPTTLETTSTALTSPPTTPETTSTAGADTTSTAGFSPTSSGPPTSPETTAAPPAGLPGDTTDDASTESTTTASTTTAATTTAATTTSRVSSTTPEVAPSTAASGAAGAGTAPVSGLLLWIVVAVLVGAVLLVGCVAAGVYVCKRRRSGSTTFPGAYSGGRQSRKHKGGQDVWAAPMPDKEENGGPAGDEDAEAGRGKGPEGDKEAGDPGALSTFLNRAGSRPTSGAQPEGVSVELREEGAARGEAQPLLGPDPGAPLENGQGPAPAPLPDSSALPPPPPAEQGGDGLSPTFCLTSSV
ncbi:mucin-7-like [Lepisosteus oculatus]|uniref:mucin-7-like n=1 Tax=Lepisosteus oculatus TaxID=7918 RepID=UPI003717BDF6